MKNVYYTTRINGIESTEKIAIEDVPGEVTPNEALENLLYENQLDFIKTKRLFITEYKIVDNSLESEEIYVVSDFTEQSEEYYETAA